MVGLKSAVKARRGWKRHNSLISDWIAWKTGYWFNRYEAEKVAKHARTLAESGIPGAVRRYADFIKDVYGFDALAAIHKGVYEFRGLHTSPPTHIEIPMKRGGQVRLGRTSGSKPKRRAK